MHWRIVQDLFQRFCLGVYQIILPAFQYADEMVWKGEGGTGGAATEHTFSYPLAGLTDNAWVEWLRDWSFDLRETDGIQERKQWLLMCENACTFKSMHNDFQIKIAMGPGFFTAGNSYLITYNSNHSHRSHPWSHPCLVPLYGAEEEVLGEERRVVF